MLRPIRTPGNIAILTAAMLLVLPGCSGVIASRGIYSLGEIPDGLSRNQVQERFGSPGSVSTTSLGRQVEIYHLRQKFKSLTERFLEAEPGGACYGGGCIGIFALVETASFLFALTKSEMDKLEVAFVYGPDDRVLYIHEPKADPSERYSQALSPMTHSLLDIEQAKCPKLRACIEQYIEEARRRAEEVGYTLTAQDEEAFRRDLELAVRVDNGETIGEIIREEVFREELPSGCRDQRKAPLSRDQYDFINKLTDRLLSKIAEGSASITDAVTRYIQQLAARFNYRLTCTDKETFKLELEIAKEADEGKITRDEAYSQLLGVTTRHLVRLYYGRS